LPGATRELKEPPDQERIKKKIHEMKPAETLGKRIIEGVDHSR
jgi:hypothetical protein